MKKIVPIILCMTFLLAACGSSNSDKAYTSVADAEGAYQYAETEYYGDDYSGNYNDDVSYESTNSASLSNQDAKTGAMNNKKIIRNASVDMKAEDVDECYSKILEYVQGIDGYEFGKQMSTSSDYETIRAEIKVNPSDLDCVLSYMEECGEIINCNTSSDDITTQYIDVQIRLDNKKKNLEKYYDYYNKAETMDDALMLQDKIDQLTAEIESYEGQLKYWNTLVSESTISLYIQQKDDPTKIEKDVEWNALDITQMGNLIYNGFTSVLNGIVSVIQWIIILILSISPLLIIAGIIIFIIVMRNRKIRKKKLEQSQKQAVEAKTTEVKSDNQTK